MLLLHKYCLYFPNILLFTNVYTPDYGNNFIYKEKYNISNQWIRHQVQLNAKTENELIYSGLLHKISHLETISLYTVLSLFIVSFHPL